MLLKTNFMETLDFTATPAYTCSKCGLGVIVIPNEKPIKACTCEAPIAASMATTIYGNGSLKG